MVLITVTKYAKKILEIVEQSRSHMTAEQIFMELRRTYPTVVLATVYNNLNRLWQDDLIRKCRWKARPTVTTASSGTTIWCARSAASCWTWTWAI